MKHICVKQHHISDCGAACLASIGRHYGLIWPLEQIRQVSGTQAHGLSVQGIKEGAEAMGLATNAYSRDPNVPKAESASMLDHLPCPAILHGIKENGTAHFLVLYQVVKGGLFSRSKKYVVMDPEDGRMHRWSAAQTSIFWSGVVVVVRPDTHFRAGDHTTPFSTRLRLLLKGQKKTLVAALLAAFIFTLLGLSTAFFMQQAVDTIIPKQDTQRLTLLGICLLYLFLCALAMNAFRTVFLLRTAFNCCTRLVMSFYRHVLYLPQRFFDQRPSGELTARVNDAFKVGTFVSSGLINIALCLFSLLFSFGVMFSYYWKLALICAGSLPLYALVYWLFDKRNQDTQRQIMVSQATLEARLVDTLRGASQIKYCTAQETTIQATHETFLTYIRHAYRGGLNALWAGSASDLITRGMSLVLLWLGATFVFSHHLSTGQLLAFYTLTAFFTSPMADIIAFSQKYRDARIASERLFEIMELDPEPTCEATSFQPGDLSLNNVSFHYPGRLPLFTHFSQTFQKGRITALAGESGSGKSTLAALLLRMYLPDEGTISLGDTPAEALALPTWRHAIGIVPQKAELFEGTLLSNILLGSEHPDMQRVADLCDQLELTEFLASLPLGILTPLGEQGVQLSGGQRQRLALVRAAYRNPQWLVLDEATSSLDSTSEQCVLRALRTWRDSGMGILVIAHRMASLIPADRILVLAQGNVVEEGTHQSLLQKKGIYAAWCRQQGI